MSKTDCAELVKLLGTAEAERQIASVMDILDIDRISAIVFLNLSHTNPENFSPLCISFQSRPVIFLSVPSALLSCL